MWIPKRAVGSLVGLIMLPGAVSAEPNAGAMLSLDDQVQQIKSDVLDIASELGVLEEQLLYPSNTQLAIFVALDSDSDVRVDAVHLLIDGEPATHHIYSFKELDALQRGGVQRLFTGNVARGEHALDVAVIGKTSGGEDFTRAQTFTFNKGVEPRMLGLTLSGADGSSLQLTDW